MAVYLSKVAPAMMYPMDRVAYSKRWVELDYVALIENVVERVMFALMKSYARSASSGVANVAAMSAIRLVHACPYSWWVRDVMEWTVLVLKDEIQANQCLETQLTTLAAIMIASRGLPLPIRVATVMEFEMTRLPMLPSTMMVPHGIVSAGLLVETVEVLTAMQIPCFNIANQSGLPFGQRLR